MDNKTQVIEYKFVKIIPNNHFNMGPIINDPYVVENIEHLRSIAITTPYYMQETPVTTGQYYEFVNDTNYETDYKIEIWDGNDWIIGPYFDEINKRGKSYPIVGVSYNDALKFIDWLSNKNNKKYRLPTEAEFEYAAKSGCKCNEKCQYAEEANKLNLCRKEKEVPRQYPREVKQGILNSWGLYDLNALLWQWCSDWFYYYNSRDIVNPQGPDEEPEYAPWKSEKWSPGKVIRGGSFSYPFFHSRCSNRHYSKITDRNFNLGFRLVY